MKPMRYTPGSCDELVWNVANVMYGRTLADRAPIVAALVRRLLERGESLHIVADRSLYRLGWDLECIAHQRQRDAARETAQYADRPHVVIDLGQ